MHRHHRRTFVKTSLVAALSSSALARIVTGAEPAAPLPSADKFIPGKDRRLIVHSAKTGEIETPLELLRDHRVTPKELLFVRNNQIVPGTLTLEPAAIGDWKIDVQGLVENPRSIPLAEIAKLTQRDVEVVIQCSGNSRTRYEKAVKTDGVPWQHGAMGNIVYRGVPLVAVLDHFGLKPKPDARFLAIEGLDGPNKAGDADFEHSVPLADALERSFLALGMNGEPLSKVHGGPVRFVTPGYYATMNVKWLNKLRFEVAESTNYHHVGRYRTPLRPIAPGSKFDSTLANSEPNWNMKIKTVIFSPLTGAKASAGVVVARGVSWNDGLAAIAAVEVSTDRGESWRRAKLERPSSPYAWHPWSVELRLPAGKHEIWARAIDALGRSQPLDGAVHWCPAGYCWNGVDSVSVELS